MLPTYRKVESIASEKGLLDAAPVLAAEHEPNEALRRWIERYVDFIRAKRGLAAALHSGDPAYDVLPAYFEKRLLPALEGLLKSAASAGCIRATVDAHDLLWAIASLSASIRAGNISMWQIPPRPASRPIASVPVVC